MKFLFVSLLAFQASLSLADEEHVCACEAAELGFEIDCANQDVTNQAMADLSTNGCDSDCSKPACEKPFVIVQSHHDFCLHSELSESVETNFHLYEKSCEAFHCDIQRKFDPSLGQCPQVDCSTNVGNEAYLALQIDASCMTNCAQESCKMNYQLLRAFHDSCDHDALDTAAEVVLHDFEEPCEDQNCNVLADSSQDSRILSCEDGEGTSSSKAKGVLVAFAIGAAALL